MKAQRVPPLAQALLRHFARGMHKESLEGDLLEEFAAGRSAGWYWRQVTHALYEQALAVARQRAATLLVAALFFLLALWVIAPATYPVMGWVSTREPLRLVVLLGWLAGVPFLLGGIAGAAGRRRCIGAILLGAGFAYLTPVTLPFSFAVCDLCARPEGSAVPRAILLLTPFGAAALAGLGAWIAGRFHAVAQQE